MSLVYIPTLRTGQNSSISTSEWDAMQQQLVTLFASVPAAVVGGTVTSVGITGLTGIVSISNSPITTAGNISLTFSQQTQNKVFASPDLATGVPTFRALTLDDIPLGVYTVNRAIVSDGSGHLFPSSVTATELGYVSGVTSAIQTQLNAKQATITVLPIANGGTGSSTAAAARVAILPSLTGKSLKILQVNVGETDVAWITYSPGITSINADSTLVQTIVAGSAGTDFTITTAGGVTTVNIPSASASNRGLVSTGAQTLAGAKTFSTAPIISTMTDMYIPYMNSSKAITGDSAFTRNRTDKYITTEEVIYSKIATLVADTLMDITYNYIRSEQTALVEYTLPLADSLPIGKEFTFKDSLGVCSAKGIKITATGGAYLENTPNKTLQLATTNFSCMTIKVVYSSTLGANVYEMVSCYGVIT